MTTPDNTITTAVTYELCARCAYAIAYDDYSAFDLTDDTADAAAFDALNDFAMENGLLYVDTDAEEFVGKCDGCATDFGGYFMGHAVETILVHN